MTTLPIFTLFGFALLAATLTFSKRAKLRSTVDIIQTLHPNVLHHLDRFLTLSFHDDAEFWILSGGHAGMRWRCDNARKLLHLFQDLVRRKVVRADELAFLSGHANLIVFFSLTAAPEAVLHRIMPITPHISARIVAILYSQMQARVKTLAAEYSPLTFSQLDAVL